MAEASQNPLLSTTHTSDNSPAVELHPLVLLTISDCITRHTLRQQPGPVVGAVLGSQNGQQITMEVAFQAKLVAGSDGEVVLDDEWFSKRLEDFKVVHKDPQLDLVGWFTLGPASGPAPHVLPIHSRISELYTESPLLLLFHPEDAFSEATAAGKLPLTLYEPLSEHVPSDASDKDMDIDGAAQPVSTKFRELVYSIETGEAEMISVDFVARGGGNATAVEGSVDAPSTTDSSKTEESSDQRITRGKQKDKGKEKAQDPDKDAIIDESTVLSAEDDEIISTLTAKINAIRMLSRRLALLRAYLSALPPSYLSDPSLPLNPAPTATHPLPLNHTILRSISAALARIDILAPPDTAAFTHEAQQEASDVQLVNLLAALTNSVAAAKELGRKSSIVEYGKGLGRRNMGAAGGGAFEQSPGGGGFFGTVLGGGAGAGGAGGGGGGDRWG